jgi:hypothetical protein
MHDTRKTGRTAKRINSEVSGDAVLDVARRLLQEINRSRSKRRAPLLFLLAEMLRSGATVPRVNPASEEDSRAAEFSRNLKRYLKAVEKTPRD